MEKRKKRAKEIEAIFKVYNGSAVVYETPKTPNKSISEICAKGTTLAAGTTLNTLLNEVRK